MQIGKKENYIFRPDSVYTLSAEETNQIVNEILGVILWGGLTPNAEDAGQMAEALRAMLYTKTEVNAIRDALQTAVNGINAKIPTEASADNKLADKQYVDALFAGTAKYMGDIRFGADTPDTMNTIPAAKISSGDGCFVSSDHTLYKWTGSAWTAQPAGTPLVGQYYNIVFFYGAWDGDTFSGEVSAQITCYNAEQDLWNLIVFTDRLTPGEATDEAIGPRTLADNEGTNVVPPVGPAVLTAHLQALRDYVKYLGSAKQNTLVAGPGITINSSDPDAPIISGSEQDGAAARTMGEVYFSQSPDAQDNPGALPLWTGEYYANGSALYPDFYSWVKRHPELCTTKAEYDSALETYGECPFYVADETEGSLRLPLLKNYVKMANASDGVTQKAAGLPNITGTWKPAGLDTNNYEDPTGAFANSKHSSNGYLGHASKTGQTPFADFDASLSNEIYGSSDTVTPSHTTLYPWVGAFNAAIPASTAQAAQFQQGLSGKADADLSNVEPLSQARVNAIMPADMDYVVERWQAAEPSVTWANIPFYNSYELYKSGWCRQYIYAANNTAVTYLKPFAKTPHIKTDMFGSAGSAYFAHNVLAVNGDLKTGCSVNWSGSEANPYGVLIVAEGFVEE